MEVTLKIEAHQIGETIEEVFKHLTPEQKMKLAEDTVRSWLSAPYAGEREAYEQQAVQTVRKKNVKLNYYTERRSGDNDVEDKEIRCTSEFNDLMREWRSTREILITSICEESLKYAKEFAISSVAADEKMKVVMETTRKSVEDLFPQMVYGAMVRWLSGNMSNVISLAQNGVEYEVNDMREELARLKSSLQIKYNMQLDE